jgi:DNA-binding NtrC family response regulator
MTAPQILVVDDELDIRSLIEEILTDEGYDVRTAADAEGAKAMRNDFPPDLCLLDVWMPTTDGITLLKQWTEGGELDFPVIVMSGHGTVETAVEATRLGAADFIEKPLSIAKLLRTVESALAESKPAGGDRASQLLPAHMPPMGRSPLIQALRDRVRSVAPHSAPVLLIGEPGSGREVFAHYLHSLSDRAAGECVSVSCGVLDDAVAAERLLGVRRGENEQPGLFEQASGGTLFLNDLQDMGPAAQRLLLGVLDQGAYAPVGQSREQPLDVRLIAGLVPGGGSDDAMRADLLAHLGVVRLEVPALRDYTEDVPELLRFYVDKLVDTSGLSFRRFNVAAQNRLRHYPWPGNLAELRNLVHRLLMREGPEEIGLEEIEAELSDTTGQGEPLIKQDLLALPLREAREEFERAYLRQQLALCGGKVGQLAKRVGMERTHLYRKLRSLGVDFRRATVEE